MPPDDRCRLMTAAALLTLTDSRLPAGGHAHSGGVEQAIAAGLITDPASLAGVLLRRLGASGGGRAGGRGPPRGGWGARARRTGGTAPGRGWSPEGDHVVDSGRGGRCSNA